MNSHSFDNLTYKPVIFSGNNAESEFSRFREDWEKENGNLMIVDDADEAAKEFALLCAPKHLKSGTTPEPTSRPTLVWVVLPWKRVAVHTIEAHAYIALRTSRNHDLITKDEAAVLSQKRIGIAGLNVGNPAAVCLAQEGIGAYMRMADNDILSLSNLNRFRASIADLGVNKAVLSARQALEINPFLEVEVWENGVSAETLAQFVSGLDILIEEMDAPPLKIAIREEARRQHIPTIMVTGNGHDIILDIERYDKEPELDLLNGTLSTDVRNAITRGPKSFDEKISIARDFMGSGFLCDRLNDSFTKVGDTLIGIPQLAEASFLRGAALAHACRGILSGEDIKSGRYAFGLSDLYQQKHA